MYETHLVRKGMPIMSTFLPSLSVRHRRRLREIVLFVIVGLLNTAIDFTVLNLLIALTNHHSGWWLIIFNCLSFLTAVTNSYILNGRVTFRHKGLGDPWIFTRFVVVNAVGLVINTGIVWLMTPLLDGTLSPIVAVNVSKALAVLVSLCWNYVAIRRWIFGARTSTVDLSSHGDQRGAQLRLEQGKNAHPFLADEIPTPL